MGRVLSIDCRLGDCFGGSDGHHWCHLALFSFELG